VFTLQKYCNVFGFFGLNSHCTSCPPAGGRTSSAVPRVCETIRPGNSLWPPANTNRFTLPLYHIATLHSRTSTLTAHGFANFKTHSSTRCVSLTRSAPYSAANSTDPLSLSLSLASHAVLCPSQPSLSSQKKKKKNVTRPLCRVVHDSRVSLSFDRFLRSRLRCYNINIVVY
jgi:hypothetical protein